nr:hypothetical protein [Tanacetum cinerariifolium]
MSSFNQRECLGCGQPCDGFHYSCTCPQRGVILLNGICINCTYGDGKPITCCVCEGPLRGGFCLFCDSKAENSFTHDPNAYYFNDTSNFNHKTYLCELCRNNSHYGYDCQQQFPFVYEQAPKIQSHTFGEKPKILLQAWEKFFAIQHAQPENSNELFQKLLEDLHTINKELAEYINSSSWDHPTFFNDNEEHYVQYKEYLENPSNEIDVSNSSQEKEKSPQDSDIRQLIREECCIKVCRKQKQNMENTMLELIEVCRQKEFYCMHNNVDDLIESALNSKLLSINLKYQHLDKKKQEVKNIVEQSTKCGICIVKSLQNFRVNKSSTSLNKMSQISSLHAITPILPTEEPEYSLSMGYEHLSTISEMESDEVIESSAKNLLPIPSEYEVTFDDENECDVPVKDESSPIFTTFSSPIFDCNDDFTSSDDESISDEDVPIEDFKVYSNPLFDDEIDMHCFNTEYEFVESLSNRDALIDSSLKFDFLEEFSSAFMPTSIADGERIRREHEEYISLMEKLFSINSVPRPEEIDIFTGTDELLPLSIESEDYDSEGDIHFLEELLVNNSISLPQNESFYFDHHDNPLFPRPPPKPPDVEFDFEPNSGEVIAAVMNNIDEINEDECFDPGEEINVFANVEDDDYFFFIFVIRIFYHISSILRFLLYFSPLGVKTPFAGGISLGWNFHVFIQTLMKARLRFSFPFALPWTNKFEDRVKLSDSVIKKALCGRHPMLIHFFLLSIF